MGDFSGQLKVEFNNDDFGWGTRLYVFLSEDTAEMYTLPWAPRSPADAVMTPFAVGYWSSVSRNQVYVLEKKEEFGQTLLHVLDLDDGSWFEPVEFDGGFRKMERNSKHPYAWHQLKTLDEFGVVETFVPCCACSDIEWVAFNAWGITTSIATDPLNGDAGFDRKGNLLITEFDSILMFRFPDYKKEVVAQFSDFKMSEALTVSLKCSEAEGNCPGIAQLDVTCGFEETKLKFMGFVAKSFAGKLSACECEEACAGKDYWMLKQSSGRCFCYNGYATDAVRREGYVSSHGISEKL